MVTRTDKLALVNEIIDSASTLPIECQHWLLSIAKGMEFTKNCMLKGQDGKQTSKGLPKTTQPPKS